MRVRCYLNLNKKVFSIVDPKTGRVIGHEHCVHLSNPKFHVREGGRQRVLRERRKNVHAFVTGDLTYRGDTALKLTGVSQAYYNPYKTETFIDKNSGERLDTAQFVVLQDRQAFYK